MYTWRSANTQYVIPIHHTLRARAHVKAKEQAEGFRMGE
jgi:hypothetical protein